MPYLIGKTNDLVFNRRTITNPSPFDPSAIKRGTVQIGPNQVMSMSVGISYITGDLGLGNRLGRGGKRGRRDHLLLEEQVI